MADPTNPTTTPRRPRGSATPPMTEPQPAGAEPQVTPSGQAMAVTKAPATQDAGMALASIAAAYPERFPVLTHEQDGDTVRILNAGLGAWEEHKVSAVKAATLSSLKKAQTKFFQSQMAALADRYARGEDAE